LAPRIFAPIPTGTSLVSLLETMPPWYTKAEPSKPTSYPMGAYDPEPDKTCLSTSDAHRVMHPDMVDAEVTLARTQSHEADHGDIRHGAVMASETILKSKACNPWGNGANDRGDGNSPGEGTASPNGWRPNRVDVDGMTLHCFAKKRHSWGRDCLGDCRHAGHADGQNRKHEI
jgi:hypothetical protein